jgi:hypothetical protein
MGLGHLFPVLVPLIQKSLQWSFPGLSAFCVCFGILGNLLQGILFTCCVQFPL